MFRHASPVNCSIGPGVRNSDNNWTRKQCFIFSFNRKHVAFVWPCLFRAGCRSATIVLVLSLVTMALKACWREGRVAMRNFVYSCSVTHRVVDAAMCNLSSYFVGRIFSTCPPCGITKWPRKA